MLDNITSSSSLILSALGALPGMLLIGGFITLMIFVLFKAKNGPRGDFSPAKDKDTQVKGGLMIIIVVIGLVAFVWAGQ